MSDYDAPTPGDIDRAAADFAKLLRTDRAALEAIRTAIFAVADVVNENVSPTPQLAGADVVAFLQALKKHLDDATFEGDDDEQDFEMTIGAIIFGHGPHG